MIIPSYFGSGNRDLGPSHTEGIVGAEFTQVDPLLMDVSDEDVLLEIEDRLTKSETSTQQLRSVQQGNRDYYLGDQLKSFDLLDWQLKTVENRIFSSIEVLIPMITANAGDPDIHCLAHAEGQEEAIEDYVATLTATVMYDYDVTYRLKDKVREIVRHWYNYRFGVGKFRYDPMTGKPVFDVIDPRNMILPSKDSPKGWKAEYKESSLAELLVTFPKAKAKLEKKFWTQGGEIPESVLGTNVGYYEYWRASFVAWKLDELVLDKRLNPNWDWEGEQRQTTEEAIVQPDGSVVINPIVDTYKWRILDAPRDPYFIFNYYLLDAELEYDTTGNIEQAKPLQDVISKRKRQITQVADDAGILIASGMGGMGIKKTEFDKYDGSPRSTMWIPDGNPNNVFARLPGAQVNTGMIADLQDSRGAIDNLFGTHDTTRGESENPNESGRARMVTRQGDISRIGPLAERVEDFLQQVYLYDIQMRALYTNTDYHVPQVTPTDTGEYRSLVFNRNTIPFIKVDELVVIDGVESMESYMKPVPITLRVRRNSTLPKDQLSEYQRTFELLQAGMTDPLSAMEKMGEVDPAGKLVRLLKFKTNPISLLPPKRQMEVMAIPPMMPMGAEGQPPAEGGKKPETPMSQQEPPQ